MALLCGETVAVASMGSPRMEVGRTYTAVLIDDVDEDGNQVIRLMDGSQTEESPAALAESVAEAAGSASPGEEENIPVLGEPFDDRIIECVVNADGSN